MNVAGAGRSLDPAAAHGAAAPGRLAGRPPPEGRQLFGRAYPWAAAIIGGLPLLGTASMGFFSRYIADDFCTAGTLRRLGFWASQPYWYLNWSGRYSFTFVATGLNALGPGITPWLPIVVLSLWLGAGVYLFRAWVPAAGRGFAAGITLALAAGLVFFTIEGVPNPYQSLYWQTGLLTYGLPLGLGTFYLGWLWRRSGEPAPSRAAVVAPGAAMACAFALGGFSETFAVLQTAVMALGLAATAFLAGRRWQGPFLLWGGGLLGSALSLLVVAVAPGNAVRQSALPEQAQWADVLARSLHDMYVFLARVGRDHTVNALLAVSVPAALAFVAARPAVASSPAPRPRTWLILVGIPAVTAVLILATIVPYEYAVSSYPDDRVLITGQYVLGVAASGWGLALGGAAARGLRPRHGLWQRIALGAAGLGLLALLLRASFETYRDIREPLPVARAYAEAWDQRHEALSRAGAENVETVAAASLRHMGGLAELGRDPQEWINRCIAWTYGLDQVVAK